MKKIMNIKLNREQLADKIHACWIGKNIGGTMGFPYEGTREFLDVKGFVTPKGEPLPNDDLDLQLAWLATIEQFGIETFDANRLAQTWQMMITPYWAEYGISKKNMEMGLLPPLSGEFDNDKWRNSNGAWIRSEIWACLAPGFPNIAIKYAIMDATIDHGLGEGTYAEIYTAALESTAFVEADTRKIIEIALEYIPSNCRVAQCVRRVLEEYDKGTPYQDVRNILVDMTKDIGWFQAPQDLGFVTIGLLYGEGDFKKSMIYTLNCGDDTDCTGATIGAIMGLIGGTKSIPEDWAEYIGDRISQYCVSALYASWLPKTCTDLTNRVIDKIPVLLEHNKIGVEFTDGDTEINKEESVKVLAGYADKFFDRARYSFDITDHFDLHTIVEYDEYPVVSEGVEFKVRFRFTQLINDKTVQGYVNMLLPEGWTAKYNKAVTIFKPGDCFETKEQNIRGIDQNVYEFTITPSANIQPVNKVYVHIERQGHPMPYVVPLTLMG